MPYKLRIPKDIAALIQDMHPLLKKRIRAALTRICTDSYAGKALKEELSGLRSFRIKRFRIIYQVIDQNEIGLVAIGPRKSIYEETFGLVKKDSVRGR